MEPVPNLLHPPTQHLGSTPISELTGHAISLGNTDSVLEQPLVNVAQPFIS